jgi:hypothetical protein
MPELSQEIVCIVRCGKKADRDTNGTVMAQDIWHMASGILGNAVENPGKKAEV